LAADFDKGEWREDVAAFMNVCSKLDIPVSVEISRSGNGAHAWIFFEEPILAREARQLGSAIISRVCDGTRLLPFTSYDRFFPNQDIMPKGGFGNLIALPLQKFPRSHNHSVFVDANFTPYDDQWAYLSTVRAMSKRDLENAILRASGGKHPLDVAYIDDEKNEKPWQQCHLTVKISGELPKSLILTLANQIFIAKSQLTTQLTNRMIRLAAFPNPEFYKAQAMRMPVWDKPRIIGCAENFPKHIALPRGCYDDIVKLLDENGILVEIQDERLIGSKIQAQFTGILRKEQGKAVSEMLAHDIGVLSAPTAFGKTVTAAAIIAKRRVSTLILLHRSELLRQWQERLTGFLGLSPKELGIIGGGKKKLSGKIDIALLQTLSRLEKSDTDQLDEILSHYGQIIVDECHHITAVSFESIIKHSSARFVLGLTATPIRRDGHQPIIFMQCGSIRHTATRSENAPTQLEVRIRNLESPKIPPDASIQDVFSILSKDEDRNSRIVQDVQDAYKEGRKVLLLTERTEHLAILHEALASSEEHCFILHGRMSKKQRTETLEKLLNLDADEPRILLATGRLIGEGFDHPPLDTMALAMPISWKGTLQQYAGRLHREHLSKQNVRIYDYVESGQQQLARMWNKRLKGYKAMGYIVTILSSDLHDEVICS
jgi:superfamily II DNA or RNA helicase